MKTATEQMKSDLGRNPEDLAREADSAREHLEGTVDELMHQFAPGELVDKGISYIRSKADFDFIRNLTRQVENNPIPTVLAAVSLIWLMNASKQPSVHGGSSSHDAADRTRKTGQRVAEGASDAMHRVSDASRSTADSARSRLRSARQGSTQMLREHPLLIGALAGMVGAGLGSLLARTSAEDRVMGELSDRETSAVEDKAEEKLHQAQNRVSPENAGSSPNAAGVPTPGLKPPQLDPTSPGSSRDANRTRP